MTGHLLAIAFYGLGAVITGLAGGACLGSLMVPRLAGPRIWQAWLIAIAGGLFFAWKGGLL